MRRQRSPRHQAAAEPRPGRRYYEEGPEKLPENSSCPRCGASYHKGRWVSRRAPAGSPEHVCPACERIETDYPAGVVQVAGAFAQAHRDELVGLLRNIEQRERAEHPLKRIMAIRDEDDGFSVSVTDASLARSFGRALERAYEGELEQPPTTSELQDLVRVRWTRD